MPSTVTCRSSMHSSSADWVLGEARLISSPTTMLAKTPPGRNSNSRVSWLKTDTPVTSEGSRSGVNWMRRTVQSMERASALASIVLPTPGTSSISRWPSASSTVDRGADHVGLALDHLLDVRRGRGRRPAPGCRSRPIGTVSWSHVPTVASPAVRIRRGPACILRNRSRSTPRDAPRSRCGAASPPGRAPVPPAGPALSRPPTCRPTSPSLHRGRFPSRAAGALCATRDAQAGARAAPSGARPNRGRNTRKDG